MATILDFEKTIHELEKKVEQLQEFSETHGVDVTQGITALEERIENARKNAFSKLNAWQRVQLARHPDRPYPRDYIQMLFSDFMELHGDRRYADDEAILGGFAKFKGRNVMLVGTQKGRDLKSNVRFNFGSAHPEGYRKALRIMEVADKAKVPIISLIDTPGAYPGIAAEERHIGEAIAVNIRDMFKLKVPVIVVVTGEGGSGGALGIGVGNRVLIMENAYYSVITPEGCAAILWRDGAKSAEAAEALRLTSADLKQLGIVDDVIPEPLGGAHRNVENAVAMLGSALEKHLKELEDVDPFELCKQRYEKFRGIGVYKTD